MEYKIQYEVTEEIQMNSLKQYFFKILLGKRIILLLLIAVFSIVLIATSDDKFGFYAGIVFGCIVLANSIMWIRSYFLMMRQGRDLLALQDSPVINVLMDENGIYYQSSSTSKNYTWKKVEKFEDTRDFLVLTHGKVPLLSLPKEFLDANAVQFAKTKITQQTAPGNEGSAPVA